MKNNKQITIDEEIMKKLREEMNASALIEKLLREHYSMSPEKKNNLMIQKQIMLKNYSNKAKQIRNEVKFYKKVEDLGADVFTIRFLRGFDLCPSPIQLINYKRGRELSITLENLQKIWEVINKNVGIFEKI